MKLITAFFRLIRWPNLLFIGLTQVLFMYCILLPLFNNAGIEPAIKGLHFIWFSLSLILVAGGGYIINDYFDLNIDIVNKPGKLVIEKIISRRWAIIWHLLLSTAGIGLGFYLDIVTSSWWIGIANIICAILLFLYSISLKKKVLSGNVLVSVLTAWSVLMVALGETHLLKGDNDITEKISRLTFLYTGFAFMASLIREVIKDMEDVDGDEKYGCRTMPIVWGMNAAKVFVAVWLFVLIALLILIQIYVLINGFGWWLSVLYCILFLIYPLIWIFKRLFIAISSEDFHRLSNGMKVVMLAGILSMIFFWAYA